jgi:branched-chain amino acid transport system substrate-binding protein
LAVVARNGGKVLGRVRHPFPATDFWSFLLQAQASKAKIIGLANTGADTVNSIKQASEFGIARWPEARRAARLHHRRARARAADPLRG